MYPVTIEQFQKFTNVEELVLQKMKEEGPKIYEANYKHRHKHCKTIYKNFYDSEKRNKTLRYGLTLKPMPQSFKAKFLQFPAMNNNAVESNSSSQKEVQKPVQNDPNSSSQKEVQKPVQNDPIPLEEKYKDDLPSTSSAFVHKPRYNSKIKPQQKLDVPSSKNINKIFPKASEKATLKNRKSLEKEKPQKKIPNKLSDPEPTKITNYFSALELKKCNPETKSPKLSIQLRKRKSDPQKEHTEQEPEIKKLKVHPAKKSDAKNIISKDKSKKNQKKIQKTTQPKSRSQRKTYSDDFVSDDSDAESNNEKKNPTNQLHKAKSPLKLNNDDGNGEKQKHNKIQSKSKQPRKRIILAEDSSSDNSGDGELKYESKYVVSFKSPLRINNNNQSTPKPKSKKKLHSADIISDNCDLNANIETIDLSSQVSRKQADIEKNNENISSPEKSLLPKRKRSEEHINTSPINPKPQPVAVRSSKDYIIKWIETGQKALEDDCDGNKRRRRKHPHRNISAEDLAIGFQLQTNKTHPEKVKKRIQYWLKFDIQMRNGVSQNLEATDLSCSSKAKIASIFSKMSFDEFKHLVNAKKYTRPLDKTVKSDKSIEDYEQNLKNLYAEFIQKEEPWPEIHIELAKLQEFLNAKGIRGPIQLKDISPRIVSFNEVLEKTNIKECISLKCKEPPETYKQLLSLCKKEYQICCIEGIWTKGLKLNDEKEENGSSQEMSIDLFTESMTMTSTQMTPHHVPNIQPDDDLMTEIEVVPKELPVSSSLENYCPSNSATKESLHKKDFETHKQKESPGKPKSSTKDSNGQQQKPRKCGPKSRQKNSLQSDDELEIRMNEILGNQDQYIIKNTFQPLMDNEELRRTLAKSQSQPSQSDSTEIQTCEDINLVDRSAHTHVIKHAIEKVVGISTSPTKQPELLSETNQVSLEPYLLPELGEVIPPSANTSPSHKETISESSNILKNVHNSKKTCSIAPPIEKLQLSPTGSAKSNYKPSKAHETVNFIPPSPNLFASSGESDPKCTDSERIEVQTQESVYVPCERSNNNFHTEQNNFSLLSISQVNESLDPFGEITANQEDTIVDGLQRSAGTTKELSISEENSTETSINRDIVVGEPNPSAGSTSDRHRETDNIAQTATVSKDVEMLQSKEPLLDPNTVPENTILNQVNVPIEPSINCLALSENSSQTINNQEQQPKEVESKESLNSKRIPKDIADSNANKLKNIAGCKNFPIEPTPQLNTVDENLVEIACNPEKTTMTTAQFAGSVQNVETVDENLIEAAENQEETTMEIPQLTEPTQDLNSVVENSTKKETTLEGVLLTETIPKPKTPDVNSPKKANNQSTNQTLDQNTISGSSNKGVKQKQRDLNASVSSGQIRNLQVVVKREIFTQSFSQYDDDVQIIEIPQSEAVVIDDEETAPELLEELLRSSPQTAYRAPITTVHVSYLTPSSSCLYNFPQAQRMPSNFDLTQSQLTLNPSVNASSGKANTISMNAEKTPANTESLGDSSDSTHMTAQSRRSNQCHEKEFLEKGSNPVEVTKKKKKTPDLKQKHPTKTSFNSSKHVEQSQTSGTGDITYVSIAPQNIPSDIEFTQTSLNKSRSQEHEECSKAIPSSKESENSSSKNISGETRQPGTTPKRDSRLTDKTDESRVSMVVCVSEACGKSNKESMGLGQSKSTKEITKAEEDIGSDKILDSFSSPQCKEIEASEHSYNESANDRDYVECKNVHQKHSSNIVEVSLDTSSDVEFVEESSDDTESVEMRNNSIDLSRITGAVASSSIHLLDNSEGEDKETTKGTEFSFSVSRDVGCVKTEVSGDIDWIKKEDKDSEALKYPTKNNNAPEVRVSQDEGEKTAVEYVEDSLSNSQGNPGDILKERNGDDWRQSENVKAEVDAYVDDNSDVELLEETAQEDTDAAGCAESFSEPLRIIKVFYKNTLTQGTPNCSGLRTRNKESEFNAAEEDILDARDSTSAEISLNKSSDVEFLEESTTDEPDVAEEAENSIDPPEITKVVSVNVAGELKFPKRSEQDNKEASQYVERLGNCSSGIVDVQVEAFERNEFIEVNLEEPEIPIPPSENPVDVAVNKYKCDTKSLKQGEAPLCHSRDVSSDKKMLEKKKGDKTTPTFNDSYDVELLEESKEEDSDADEVETAASSKTSKSNKPHTRNQENVEICKEVTGFLDTEDILRNKANFPPILAVTYSDHSSLDKNAGVCEDDKNQSENKDPSNSKPSAKAYETAEIGLQNLFPNVITPSNKEVEQVCVKHKKDEKSSRDIHKEQPCITESQLKHPISTNKELIISSEENSLHPVRNNNGSNIAVSMEVKTKNQSGNGLTTPSIVRIDYLPGDILRKEKECETKLSAKAADKKHCKEFVLKGNQKTSHSDIESPTNMETRGMGPFINDLSFTNSDSKKLCSKAPNFLPIESSEEKQAREYNENKHLLRREHEDALESSKATSNAKPCETSEDKIVLLAQKPEASKLLSLKIPNKVDSVCSKASFPALTSTDPNQMNKNSLNVQLHETSLNNSSNLLSKDPKNDACEKPAAAILRQSSEENAKTHRRSSIKENPKNIIQEQKLKASSETVIGSSKDKETLKHTPESETYSQAFKTLVEMTPKSIVTSTQLEIVAPVENNDESLQAFGSSHDSSVEFIDLTAHSMCSNDEDEEKFSNTVNFAELSTSNSNNKNTSKAKSSKNNSCYVELSENSKDDSECIVPDNIVLIENLKACVVEELPPTSIDASKGQHQKSLESVLTIRNIPKAVARNSEASPTACKENLSTNKTLNKKDHKSSCDAVITNLSASPEVIIHLKQNFNGAQISKDCKIIEQEEILHNIDLENQSPKATFSENKVPSINSTEVEQVESADEENLSHDLGNRANAVINNDDCEDIPAEKPKGRDFSSKSLQSSAFVEKTTIGLKNCIASNENINHMGIDTRVIDHHTTEVDQGCTSQKRTEAQTQTPRADSNITNILQNTFEMNTKHMYRGNKNIRRRTMSEQQMVTGSAMSFSFTKPSEANKQTLVLPAFLPISAFQANQRNWDTDSGNPNQNKFVEVPFMIDRNLLKSLPFSVVTLDQNPKEIHPTYAISVDLELKLNEQQIEPIENSKMIVQNVQMNPTIPQTQYEEKSIDKSIGEILRTDRGETEKHPIVCRHSLSPPPKKLKIKVGNKIKGKLPQACKKKTTPKKSSKLPDFVPQKTHAFSSLPLAAGKKPPQSKPCTAKQPSLLTIEECDYIIEDASLPMPTTSASQILGTDCTYFENSDLLRNLDNICIPHHPDVPALQIDQLPPPPSSILAQPTTSKVINLIPKIMSEGVTARKVWQVNLQWKSRRTMSIEVRFSVNKHSMTVCDESAKLLFNFTPAIWSDVHRILREIDHFEYKRFTSKKLCKTTPLHKVLRQLFHSSSQIVDVKLVNDSYSPYTVCEKTIPVYRKPFQCLTKGIDADILNRMRLLKENLQNNNSTVK